MAYTNEVVDVTEYLFNKGWSLFTSVNGNRYVKRIQGVAEAGQFSDGARLVTLEWCERFRYLSVIDGWGTVLVDVDKRMFDTAEEMIYDLFSRYHNDSLLNDLKGI